MAMIKGMTDAKAMMEQMMHGNDEMNSDQKLTDVLTKAIEMHQMHLDNPESATEESQVELMNLLKQALALTENGDMENG